MDDFGAEWWGWFIFGLAAVIILLVLISWGWAAGEENSQKDKAVRLAKIEACTTIQDEALRAVCLGDTY